MLKPLKASERPYRNLNNSREVYRKNLKAGTRDIVGAAKDMRSLQPKDRLKRANKFKKVRKLLGHGEARDIYKLAAN